MLHDLSATQGTKAILAFALKEKFPKIQLREVIHDRVGLVAIEEDFVTDEQSVP